MKILHVSGYDTLGIQANGYLLHCYFREKGHQSSMFVHERHSDDPDVHSLYHPVFSRLNGATVRLESYLSLWGILPAEAISLLFRRAFWQADIVHLHLVHNAQFFPLLLLPVLCWLKGKRRVVLSAHDMFIYTGHCIYSEGCELWRTGCARCPDISIPFPMKKDRSALVWRIKRAVFALSRLQLIAGSPWIRRNIAASPILRGLPVRNIDYGVDTRRFRVKDKRACRERFSIPPDADVIAFRYTRAYRNFKGSQYLDEALARYVPRRETYIIAFEQQATEDTFHGKYRVVSLGWTNTDQDLIADALNAADIFLMPSTSEAFGLMAVEAMACGTPAIVFEGTALPETIDAPHSGIAVPAKDSAALANAIERILGDPAYRARLAENGLKHVAEKHNFERYADAHLALYRDILGHVSPL